MLALRNIDKAYGATVAVRSASLEASPGTVLGLVGENGAGKSTLIKIVSGAIRADAGEIALDGRVLAPRNTNEALACGIASVFQELTLLRNLTVEENLFLTDAPLHPWGSIHRGRMRRRARALLDRYELALDPDRIVTDLALGQQQMLEILRAVERKPKVLLLDEATSALGAHEVEWLAVTIERLRKQGTIVLFISHRWDEIVRFSDRAAVMRNGEVVAVCDTSALSQDEAVHLMTGQALTTVFPPKRKPTEDVRLVAKSLNSRLLHDVGLSLHAGEILGLGGLVGQGQGALLETLFGERGIQGGAIEISEQPAKLTGPRRAIKSGIAYVPQERKTEGLLLQKNVAFNMTLATLRKLASKLGVIDARKENAKVETAIAALKIKARSGNEPIRNLSGGNQQKVLLQKWLFAEPSVLLLNDVTRGVDIATKLQIYQLIAEIAERGVGIVWYSTDAMELVGMAHRVLVMLDGRINADLQGAQVALPDIIRASIFRKSTVAADAR